MSDEKNLAELSDLLMTTAGMVGSVARKMDTSYAKCGCGAKDFRNLKEAKAKEKLRAAMSEIVLVAAALDNPDPKHIP